MKDILGICLNKTAAMVVIKLLIATNLWNDGKLNMSLNPSIQQAQEREEREENVQLEVIRSREKSNMIKIVENACSCRKWQEHKYPCSHAMAYSCKWEKLSSPQILKYHVYPYYIFKSMQQTYGNNIFTVVRDQIWHDCKMNPPSSG